MCRKIIAKVCEIKDPQKFTAVQYVHVVLFYNQIGTSIFQHRRQHFSQML